MALMDFKSMSKVELRAKIDEMRDKYFRLSFKYKNVENKDLKEMRILHKDIARLLTIINDRRK